MNYNQLSRYYDKEIARLKKDYGKYMELCNRRLEDIDYEDMLFKMKYDAVARPLPEFQKFIPGELKPNIIDEDLLALKNKYSGDKDVENMLKILQMIRITNFRAKNFLEVGKKLGASNDDPTYESYGSVKFLIYWSAFVPIKAITDKYNNIDNLFKTEFHKNIYNDFINDTYKARRNFDEVADRLREIAIKQSQQRMESLQREKEKLINRYNNGMW